MENYVTWNQLGPHEEVAGRIAGIIYAEILRANLNWLIPKSCLIKLFSAQATALRPDVILLDKTNIISYFFNGLNTSITPLD